MTADAAVKAVRRQDPDGSLLLVSREEVAPYKRPPLSKGLWNGDDESRVDLKTAEAGADLLLGRTARRIDLETGTVSLDDGASIGYDQLLIATGARARSLPGLPASERIVPYRTFSDYRRVRRLAGSGRSAAIIGGGFIGSEMAAALTRAGVTVTMLFPESAIGGGRFPEGVATAVTRDYQERGVRVLPGRTVQAAAERGDGVALTLDDGTELETGFVLVGVGAVPNDELAKEAGLLTDRGIVVDDRLRALRADGGVAEGVYAAGDVASFEWAPLGGRFRIEHEDNAYSMGAAAGRAMATAANGGGQATLPRYAHLPFFYSDLFDAGYEAVGLLDARLEVVEQWQEPGKEGVFYYVDDGLVRGVLLWNTWGQVDAARDLIEGGERFRADELIGRLPVDD